MPREFSEDEIDNAFRARDAAALQRLLDEGLDANWKNAAGDTLLHAAAKRGDTKLIEHLAEKGARANVFNNDGETPRDVATAWGHDEAAGILKQRSAEEKLTRGNDPIPYASLQQIRDKARDTGIDPLHEIAQRGQFNQVIPLAVNDAQGLNAADLLSKGLDGDTLLLKICQQGQLPLLLKPELWMKKPQDAQRIWEKVPLHYRKEVDYDAFISQLRQARLQAYGKPKLKGFHK